MKNSPIDDAPPKIVILYSSPDDAARLRIDKEDRAVGEVIQRLNVDPNLVRRCHGARLSDLTKALSEVGCEIVQFSGHGDSHGLYFESDHGSGGITVPAAKLARILQQTNARLKAAVFVACFSSEIANVLEDVAPFLITVSGSAEDTACIDFVSGFYDGLFRSGSIEQAFRTGLMKLDVEDRKDGVKPVLTRRSVGLPGRKVIQIYPNPKFDSIFVDTTEAEPDIDRLGVERDYFLFLLTRKLGVHRWIFRDGRDRAFISIGPYFGVFSWKDGDDLLVCKQIMRLKPGVDDGTCEAWAYLLTSYNDVRSASYRSEMVPNTHSVTKGYNELALILGTFFEGRLGKILREVASEEFTVARASVSANLNLAEYKLHEGDLGSSISYLEVALSAIHDMVDALAARLLLPGRAALKRKGIPKEES